MIRKIVFITGGDKGIGRGIVEQLATQYECVIFTYNTNQLGADLLTQQYPNVVAYQCNLADKDNIDAVANDVLHKYGCVDILVNNAAVENDAIFRKMEFEQWEQVLKVDLESLFHFAHHFLPKMVEKKWGRVINFSSIAGYTGVFGKANYAAAKAGVVAFTKSLAQEYGRDGITVNGVAPGAIKTDMLMRIPEKYRDNILANIPSHQFGDVSDVANLVEFLISDKASYINGQTIHINGGSYCV